MKNFIFPLIRAYQKFLSFWLGGQCRFYPSCSEYFKRALEKYQTERAVWMGFKRIMKCHPLHPGGVDLP